MPHQTRESNGQSPSTSVALRILVGCLALGLSACSTWRPLPTASSSQQSAQAGESTQTSSAGFAGQGEPRGWASGLPGGQTSLMQVSFASEGADFDPEVDPSGNYLVYASTQHAQYADIYRKKVGGNTLVQLTSDPAEDVMPTISPDGKWIAFASNRSGNWDIWVMPFAGGPASQVTFEVDHELHPSFSPDGSQLVYCRRNERSDRWEIWSFDLDTPGIRTYLCDGLFPQWCPDSSRNTILFQRARERGGQYFGIWTADLKNESCTNITEIVAASNSAIMHPSWSPNGKLICYCTVSESQASGLWPRKADVWMIGIDGTGQAPLTAGSFRNMQPTWSQNGRIYFVSDRGGTDSIWAVPAAASGPSTGEPSFTVAETTDASN